MPSIRLIPFALAVAALYALKQIFFPRKTKAPLPPGPKGLPIVGNIKDLVPAGVREWEHWLKHKDLYGPISSVTIFGQTLIIISDPEVAFDLMERRSANYSGRPYLEFSCRMIGWENTIAALQRGDHLRTSRRYAHTLLGSNSAVSKFNLLLEAEAGRFLLRTLEQPSQLVENLRKEAGAIILKAIYNYTIEPHQRDPFVDLADEGMRQFSAATMPGAWLVDTIPSLQYLPDWVPGTGFKRTARLWRKTLVDLVDKPYSFTRQQMERDTHHESMVSSFLQQPSEKAAVTPQDEFVVKWTAVSLYLAGSDTTVSTLYSFFLAMTLYPDVQQKAQEEIDRVVGTGRLPGLEDRDKLPYIDAVVTEALRWHPVLPVNLPHAADGDDTYNGYLIPKGSIIIPNIWWFLHDPKSYPEPMAFKPERFLGENPAPDARLYCFGFGRRICSGRLLANNSVFLTIAQSLAAFSISKPSNGKEPKVEFTAGMLSHALPFECEIKPRSPEYERLVRNIEREHPWPESDAEAFEKL